MKRIIGLMIVCVGFSLAQTSRPVVVNIVGALPQDSLNARVMYQDSSAVSGTALKYVTPTMHGTKVAYADSSATAGTALKYVTPTMLGTKVAVADSSAVSGTAGKYTTPTMLGTKVAISDSSAVSGTAGKYTTPTMLGVKVSYSDSSAVSGTALKYVTPTMLGVKADKAGYTTTGVITATDSTTSVLLKSSDGKKWLLRVYTNGALIADSTGQN